MDFIAGPDGVRIATHTLGSADAAPALFLPGGPCRGVEYLGDLAGLGESRRLTVLHPRGTAHTDGLSRGWWRDAEDVIAVADASDLDAVDLVAHSAGTRLALATAAQYPGRVRSMLLITPPATWLAGVPSDSADLAARRDEPDVIAALASMAGSEPTTEAEFQHALRLEAPAGYARWTTTERAHSTVGAMRLAAAVAWFRDIPADAAAMIRSARLPRTLVLGGREDLLTGFAPVRAYADALGAHAVFLDDCGHYPWVEQPDAFRNAAVGWLAA